MSALELRVVIWKEGRYTTAEARIGRVSIGRVSWRMTRETKDWVAFSSLFDTRQDFDKQEDARAWVEAEALALVNAIARPVASPSVSES